MFSFEPKNPLLKTVINDLMESLDCFSFQRNSKTPDTGMRQRSQITLTKREKRTNCMVVRRIHAKLCSTAAISLCEIRLRAVLTGIEFGYRRTNFRLLTSGFSAKGRKLQQDLSLNQSGRQALLRRGRPIKPAAQKAYRSIPILSSAGQKKVGR